ncbi:MAG: glycosyltransferase [Alphaproteobacteria bacterium]|nr:glycosyltransferase [Alphaproteobacteria bacterium]
MKRRLLQAMAGARTGGAEAFFERLVAGMARAGVMQQVAIRRDAERAGRLRQAAIEPIELPFGGWFDFVTRRRLRALIAEFRPEVVLSWMNRATEFVPEGDFVHVARLGGYYDLKYYRRCHHLIANTHGIRAYLIDGGWPAARTHYLPNFVDAAPAPAVPRADLATPEDAPLALALGRLHVNKGFDVLLRAMTELPTLHLWLAGDGPLEGELKDLARQLGIASRVRFLGWRRDTAALLASCDFLVCPSRHEPLGNVVIEAWAHGRAVVAAASEGPSELIGHRDTGLLAAVDDVTALATAMREIWEDRPLRTRLAEAGRSVYAREFTEAAVVARYGELLDRVTR